MSFGGGGSGGGGGGSGKVEYPTYIMTAHNNMLGDLATGVPNSLTGLLGFYMGNSPFSGLTAFDPTTYISDMESALTASNALITAMSYETDWEDMVSIVVTQLSAGVAGEIAAFDAEVDNQINVEILPRFQRGMQDINAVYSSSFIMGEAYIESEGLRQKNKYAGQLRRELIVQGVEQLIKLHTLKLTLNQEYVKTLIDQRRMAIVASKEETDINREIDEKDTLWDFELVQRAGNFISAPGGGVMNPKGPSATQSMLGTAMSGLGIGAMLLSTIFS